MLKLLLVAGKPNKEQSKDFDFLLVLGELFTLVRVMEGFALR